MLLLENLQLRLTEWAARRREWYSSCSPPAITELMERTYMAHFWSHFRDAACTFGPMILQTFPATRPLAKPISDLIVEAEQIPGSPSSSEKKQHVMLGTNAAIDAYNAEAAANGQPTLNKSVTLVAADKGVDAVIATINAVKAVHQEMGTVPAPIEPSPAA